MPRWLRRSIPSPRKAHQALPECAKECSFPRPTGPRSPPSRRPRLRDRDSQKGSDPPRAVRYDLRSPSTLISGDEFCRHGSGRSRLPLPRGAGCLRGSRWRGMHHPVNFILQDAPYRGAPPDVASRSHVGVPTLGRSHVPPVPRTRGPGKPTRAKDLLWLPLMTRLLPARTALIPTSCPALPDSPSPDPEASCRP